MLKLHTIKGSKADLAFSCSHDHQSQARDASGRGGKKGGLGGGGGQLRGGNGDSGTGFTDTSIRHYD